MWEPGPRPEWVDVVNAGGIEPITEEGALPFDRDRLLGEARARTALVDFGSDDFLEPLDVLLPALEDEARLTILGRWTTRRFLLRLLTVRLQLVRLVADDPGILDEDVAAPLVVTGAPRSGTTILHGLLAVDPAHRVPLGWELLLPVPPPDPATRSTDPRIALADAELRMLDRVAPGMDAVHVYGGRMPKECVSSMSFAFRSEEFTARYRVPSYAAWLATCDMRPAYDAHRLVLQVLQRQSGPATWVLKSPVHLHSLPTLRAVYPDAPLAVTHRDPLSVLGSVSSLIARLRWVHSDHVDLAEIGAYHAALYHRALDGLVDLDHNAGALPGPPMHHSHYADFLRDPVGTVAAVYAAAGHPFTPPVEDAVRQHLAARPQGQHGEHEYSFDDLGLDEADQRTRFRRYQRHFGVPSEG